MFALDTEGSFLQGFSLTGFSEEATGVAYWRDPSTSEESLFITDDEEQAVCRVSLDNPRSEEHTSELQSLMRISYAVFCLKKKHTANQSDYHTHTTHIHT